MKKTVMILLVVFLVIVLAAAGLVGWLSVMEYKPDDIEVLQVTGAQSDRKVRKGEMIGVVTMNVGYGGLGAEQDFFMDGGTMTRPQSKAIVEENT
ncbi:MAG: endonuclease, partial [Clostridia bacterium]|nr:endonuclease [Clostridia bacterium]